MKPLNKLATATIPNNGGELTLSRREDEFSLDFPACAGN